MKKENQESMPDIDMARIYVNTVFVGEHPGVVMRVADGIHDRRYIIVEYICPGGDKVDWVHYGLIKKK